MPKNTIHLGALGLGTIFRIQQQALADLPEYKLCALCDRNGSLLRDTAEKLSLPAYGDIDALVNDPGVDAVLIALPVPAHFEAATACLLAGKAVLLEKPATLSMAELDDLYRLAKETGTLLHVAYHASFAPDLLWYTENREQLGLGPVRSAEMWFFDPYLGDDLPLRAASLVGSWVDSGINALSVLDKLTDLSALSVSGVECLWQDDINLRADVSFSAPDGFSALLHTDWTQGLNLKRTLLRFDDPKTTVELHHSNQQVILRKNGCEELLFDLSGTSRLYNHYIRTFGDFARALRQAVAADPREKGVPSSKGVI